MSASCTGRLYYRLGFGQPIAAAYLNTFMLETVIKLKKKEFFLFFTFQVEESWIMAKFAFMYEVGMVIIAKRTLKWSLFHNSADKVAYSTIIFKIRIPRGRGVQNKKLVVVWII